MFDFENWIDVLMLLLLWAGLCLALPVTWWFMHSEWVLGQMIGAREGLMLFEVNWLVALFMSARIRRSRGYS